jgi:hypothetical protein
MRLPLRRKTLPIPIEFSPAETFLLSALELGTRHTEEKTITTLNGLLTVVIRNDVFQKMKLQ